MFPTASEAVAALDPHRLREDFPILARMIHGDKPLAFLDNAASSQQPKQVIQAVVEMCENYYANVHRGIHWLSEESTDRYEQARGKVRAMIGAQDAEEIIFTQGTTAAINTVARSWCDSNLVRGDRILLSVMEHHSNLVPWQQAAERTGAVLDHIPIHDDGRLDLESFDRLLTERTRLVAITGVSNVLGTINPLEAIVPKAHAAGALVLVDAAQLVPHHAVDVRSLDCDFLAFSGHKMVAPTGIGVLYGKRPLLEAMPPMFGGGGMIHEVRLDRFSPGELPAKFEAGTPPITAAIGLGMAADYLRGIGWEAIETHERHLTRRAHDILESVPGLTIHGPAPEHKAGIVSFSLRGIHAHDVAQVLDRYGIAVRAGHHCTQPLHERLGVAATTRASFYFYNTLEEIDRLGEALWHAKRLFRQL